MKYVYLIVAIIGIAIISLFTFKEDLIYYNYAKYTVKDENVSNNYYYSDNFMYLDNYEDIEIHNKNELYNTIYYIVNSGISYAERYFSIDYTDYEEDYSNLFSDNDKLNIINNFVHPYNTFSSIEASLKGYVITIRVKYNDTYNLEVRNKIDTKIEEIISNNITTDMSDRDKVKVLHDYIINNTKYDQNFCIEEDKSKCTTTSNYKADTAYGVLFEGYGICSGYTDLMSIMLYKLGIVNYRVSNESHTWNSVKLDNKWYILDVTWDDPISEDKDILTDTYFLITPEEDLKLEESHTYNKEIFLELS